MIDLQQSAQLSEALPAIYPASFAVAFRKIISLPGRLTVEPVGYSGTKRLVHFALNGEDSVAIFKSDDAQQIGLASPSSSRQARLPLEETFEKFCSLPFRGLSENCRYRRRQGVGLHPSRGEFEGASALFPVEFLLSQLRDDFSGTFDSYVKSRHLVA